MLWDYPTCLPKNVSQGPQDEVVKTVNKERMQEPHSLFYLQVTLQKIRMSFPFGRPFDR